MNERKIIPESELETKYLAGQPMKTLTEKDGLGLVYAVGNPIKNSSLARTEPLFYGEFGKVTQALWALRHNPEFIGYVDGKDMPIADVLGIDEQGGDFVEQKRRYNIARSDISEMHWADNSPSGMSGSPKSGLIYVPPLTGKIREGILTDIVRAYKGKALTIPFDESWLKEAEEKEDTEWRDYNQAAVVQNIVSALIPTGLAIPHMSESKMDDLSCLYWNPAKMTNEEYMLQAEKNGITPLEDKVGHAIELVREYTPENLERFEKAVGGFP